MEKWNYGQYTPSQIILLMVLEANKICFVGKFMFVDFESAQQ